MLEKLHAQSGMDKEEILRNIIGYSTLIDTPFGQRCALYADHTATGRPFKMIEDMIQQKIKPMVANSHTETSLMGYFSTQMLHYAEVSILKSFKVSKATHFSVPCGNGATGAFERLTKILRVADIAKMETFKAPDLEKAKNPNIPAVYITPYEHHSNILPWQNDGCNLQMVKGDKYGNMNIEDLQDRLIANSHFKIQIVSVSATSNVTSQRTDLSKVNGIIKNYKEKHLLPGHKIFFISDCAAFCSHNRLNLSDEGLSEIDFVCISPHKHLGGSESTGVLIAKLSAYDLSQPPSFPGGGTVKAVVGLESDQTWYDSDPTAREMPGTPNAIGFYRAALTFELQDYIGLEFIIEKEEQNAKYFYNRIQQINEEFRRSEQIPPRNVHIYGDTDIEIRYDVFSFNIYGPGTTTDAYGKSLFHPNFVARILNDVFGIQVRSGCSCAGPYGVLLLGIPQKKAVEIVGEMLNGYEDVKPGWVRVDTFFSFDKYELDYIIEAIRLIAIYGERIMRFYEQNVKTAQFNFRGQSHPTFDFSLFGLQRENINEIALEERPKYLADQLEIGTKIMENPQEYIKENFPHLIEGIKSENNSDGSRSFNQSRSSGISGKSIKALRPLVMKKENDSTSNKSQTKIPQAAKSEEMFKNTGSNSNSNIKNMISASIRDEIRHVLSEMPNISQRLAEPQIQSNTQSKLDILKNVFNKYSSQEASGSVGIDQINALQFAQDYNILSSNKVTINELIHNFSTLAKSKKQDMLLFPQFTAFIENIAIQVFQNSDQYITINDKLEAFYSQYLQKQNVQTNKVLRRPLANNNNAINWNNEIKTLPDENTSEYIDNKLKSHTPVQFSSKSTKNLSSKNINDNIFNNRKMNKVQPNSAIQEKVYFYADSYLTSSKSQLQAQQKKELMIQRAQEIKKQLKEHEKNLYAFISK
ncbi:hypothetical protein ABPG72_009355 [Tetrahymena utriculariae]